MGIVASNYLWGFKGRKSLRELTLEQEAADLRERVRLKDLEAEVKALRAKLGVKDV